MHIQSNSSPPYGYVAGLGRGDRPALVADPIQAVTVRRLFADRSRGEHARPPLQRRLRELGRKLVAIARGER
jgi:hypothetical protein